jgi:tRNA A-37 threonylcarbamoyl transferase component Bud32
MDLVDQTLGQFQIVEQIGKGGMAIVYKAYQASLQRHVAIKVLSPKLSDDMDLVKRFLREATSAGNLRHPNVLIIHDVGSEGDIHYIVSELLEGMTLARLLQEEGALAPDRIANIVGQIASALDYAHSRGYIHRDIKPSNIMVDPARNDHVTLMDFGLVQAPGGSRITRTGFIMGTPDYMSPEQAKGDAIDRRTDIYSLGVTVYHMLTGEVPFAKSTPHAVLLAHIMEDPPSMSTSSVEISSEVEAVVRKSMAKDPNDRYEWAGELASDLDLAVTSPTTFTAPPIRPSMYPQTPATMARGAPGGPYGQTPPPGPPGAPYAQTPPGGVTPYPQTPPGGVTPYLQTPPPGYAQTPYTQPVAKRPGWLWPVIGLTSFALLAALVVAGILLWPRIGPQILGQATPTTSAMVATATPTAAPKVVRFEVDPREIRQGESVTIRWQVSGVSAVTIQPSVRESASPSGEMQHKPGETTMYKLVFEGGESQEVEVVVNPAPGAPQIEYFRVEPTEQIPGGEVTLSWKVTGETTKIELSQGFSTVPGQKTEDQVTVVVDRTTRFVLNAYNGELLTSETQEVKIVDPTATPTEAPEPTETPTATPTEEPPTPTPTTAPPTPTSPPQPQATATPRPAAPGVVQSFEQWATWTRGEQPYGEFSQSTEQVKSGSYSAKLAYDYGGATSQNDFVVFYSRKDVGGQPNMLSAWVYGDQSGHYFNVWIQDAEEQVWSVHLGQITFSGWKQLSGAIDPNRPWPSGKVFGTDNGKIDYPIKFFGVVLDRVDGPRTGAIYLDDIAVSTAAADATPVPGATATPEQPGAGEVGRIIYTVQIGEDYQLWSTDPNWSKGVKIGDTELRLSTCPEENTNAIALDGTTVGVRPIERCQIAGTVGSCPSPDGKWKVNTANHEGTFSLILWDVNANKMKTAYYEGKLNIYTGLNWARDSSHFLFTVDHSVYRADVSKDGFYQVIPFKDKEWPLQYTPAGSQVYYLKPVSGAIADIFIANPDGSGERNLTNAGITIKLCPRWKR